MALVAAVIHCDQIDFARLICSHYLDALVVTSFSCSDEVFFSHLKYNLYGDNHLDCLDLCQA